MLRITKIAICCFSAMLLSEIACAQGGSLPRSTPAGQNVSQDGITDFIAAAVPAMGIHSFMVVRHGKVVAEQWFGDNAPDKPHVLNSVSKTFTSAAIGFAVAEGRLKVTDKVISFFPDKLPDVISENLAAMQVHDLLTMSMGTTDKLLHIGYPTEPDWAKAILALPVPEKPGSRFAYNADATYLLSAIIQKLTGQKLIDYLYPRLFQPLGIAWPVWEENDEQINVGAGGLFVKTEDMAKLGLLILQKGKWNGRQLLPESWIAEMTAKQIENVPAGKTPKEIEESDWWQGYGYQMWRCRHNAVRADGAAGQFIIILPEKDAVIAITAYAPNMQTELNLVWEHLLPALKN